MHNPFELPLFIEIKPSHRFILVFYLIHLGAIPVMQFSHIPLVIQIPVIAGVLISLIHGHYMYISRKHPDSTVRLVLNQAGEWLLELAHGSKLTVTLKPMTFVHPMLVVMSFQGDRRIHRVILTPDTLDADTFRRLRVRLRFKKE